MPLIEQFDWDVFRTASGVFVASLGCMDIEAELDAGETGNNRLEIAVDIPAEKMDAFIERVIRLYNDVCGSKIEHVHEDPEVPCEACKQEADARRPFADKHAQPATFIAVGRCVPFDQCPLCLTAVQIWREDCSR